MNDEIKKVRKLHLTKHQKQNIEADRDGHNYDLDDAERLIEDHEHTDVQTDGRIVTRGWLDNKYVQAVLSCTPFTDGDAGLVTMFRSRPVKKKDDDTETDS